MYFSGNNLGYFLFTLRVEASQREFDHYLEKATPVIRNLNSDEFCKTEFLSVKKIPTHQKEADGQQCYQPKIR